MARVKRAAKMRDGHSGSWVLAVVLVGLLLLGSCSASMERPALTYSFSHPYMNEQWTGAYHRNHLPDVVRAARQAAVPAGASGTAQAAKAPAARKPVAPERSKAAAAGPAGSQKKTPGTVTSRKSALAPPPPGPAPELDAGPGFLPAARRIVGFNDFDSELFVRHLLFVSGVQMKAGSGQLAEELTSRHSLSPQSVPKSGDLLFFGQNGKVLLCGVAETVSDDGQVVFIAPFHGTIKRLNMNLLRREVIRDERGGRISNSVISRGLTAGRAFLGSLGLAEDHGGPGFILASRQ